MSPRRGFLPPVYFPLTAALGALGLAAVVAVIYRSAAVSYLFNDDFHWMAGAPAFRFANIFDLDRYTHFYRPVIEMYFAAGRTLFGCDPRPFHLASIAIHLLNTLILFCFARSLTGRFSFAWLAALLFCTQPGYTEAVAWVAAITDLLPATWFLLTLWLYVLFVQQRRWAFYALSLATFAACLLTHETSAVLLPMMIALDVTVLPPMPRRKAIGYVPFAALLAGALVITHIVNSRSYLIRESHYAFGWHAVPHALQYVVSLYVGRSIVASYYLVAAVMALLVWRGTPRVRLFVVWIFVTLAPASFFTWGNESRYLYVPAAGFAMLLAELLQQAQAWLALRTAPATARAIVVAAAALLAVRFGVYAEKGSQGYRTRALPYERYAAAVRQAAAAAPGGGEITVSADAVEGVPELYRDPAAEIALCTSGIHVVIR